MSKSTMKKVNLYIPAVMDTKLRELSEKTDAPVAALIRRAIAAYLLGQK